MRRKMRNSIAKKTILPILLIYLLMSMLISVAVYRYVSNDVFEKGKVAMRQITQYFQYQMWIEALEDSSMSDEDFIQKFKQFGEDVCEAFQLDFASMYVPHPEEGTIEYLMVAYGSEVNDNPLIPYMMEYEMRKRDYQLNEEEMKVWNGELEVGFAVYSNRYGYELCAEALGMLPSGETVMMTLERSYLQLNDQIIRSLSMTFGLIFLVYLLICVILYLIIWRNVTRPAKLVSEAMNAFVADGSRSGEILDEKRTDEFGTINRAFNRMADNITRYVENIGALTEEQHRQKTEIDIAGRIQMGFLPPREASFNGCEINAMILPARDVGGDLYDYLKIDDDRVLVTIADVAGKGLSAAGFMSVTLALLHQYASLGLDPAEILKETNGYLVAKNPSMLFVTAFVGIYNNRTREFTYSNAGHNLPYVLNRETTMLSGAEGTVLGLFEDETFSQTTLKLQPGDSLYLYTDGVNEAVNTENRFYGTNRLEEALRRYRPSLTKSLLQHMEESVHGFSGGAAQNDDITMLSLTAKEQTELNLRADVREFQQIKKVILESVAPEDKKRPLCLVAEEIFVNIVSYAFGENQPEEPCIRFLFAVSDHVRMRFEDGGVPYNPLLQVTTAEEYDADEMTGGLGKLIAFGIADDMRYEYEKGKNILTLVKYKEDPHED